MHQYYGPRVIDEILLQASVFVVLSAILTEVYTRLLTKKSRPIPRVGKDPGTLSLVEAREEFLKNGHKLIQEGYDKYGDHAFVVQTADMERVVLSRRYVHELRSLPEDTLSLRRAMSERHLGQYTSLNIIRLSHLQNEVCRNQLQQNLSSLMQGMEQEIKTGLEQNFKGCRDFQAKNVYGLVLGCVARAASRCLVGETLCRDPAWLDTAIGYTADVFAVSQMLRNRHWAVRPFVYALSDERSRLRKRITTARQMLVPLLDQRASGELEATTDDLLKWMTESAKGSDKSSYRLSDKTLFLCLASIHTSTSTAVHALFDLCAHQVDVLDALKQEIAEGIKQHGGLTLPALNKMKKLDSFLKESQRMSHPGLLSFNRRVIKKITLSDGTVLPAGTFISIPTAMIAKDPTLYDSPDLFHPWRFVEKRNSAPTEANKHQFASTSIDSLPFGLGKFACPGRFFAAALIKQLLAQLILDFEFRFPNGQTERPENIYLDERIAPDTKQQMEFRRKAVA